MRALHLNQVDAHPDSATPSISDVVAAVARAEGVAESFVCSGLRDAAVARGIAFYLIRQHIGTSYPKLGARFKCDHTTAIHWCGRVSTALSDDPPFRRRVEAAHSALAERFALVPVDHYAASASISPRMSRSPIPPPVIVNAEPVVAVVAHSQGVSVSEVMSPTSQAGRFARGLAMYLVRDADGASLNDIARLFGLADHSTVFYWTSRFKAAVASSGDDAAAIAELKHRLNQISLGVEPLPDPIDTSRAAMFDEHVRAAAAVVGSTRRLAADDVLHGVGPDGNAARSLAMHLVRATTRASVVKIGASFDVHHTTVLHGLRRVGSLIADDPSAAAQVLDLQDRVARVAAGAEPYPPAIAPLRTRGLEYLPTITAVVADAQRLSIADLQHAETDRAALARGLAVYIARTDFAIGGDAIVREYGLRDHTSVLRWCERVTGIAAGSPWAAVQLASLRERVRQVAMGAIALPTPQTNLDAVPFVDETITLRRATVRVHYPDVAPAELGRTTPRVDRVAAMDSATARIVEAMRPCAAVVVVDGERAPLGQVVRGPHGLRFVDALKDIYLIDRLTAVDAERAGVGSQRRAAIARMERADTQVRRLTEGLRRAIAPQHDPVMRAVGIALNEERQLQLQARPLALGLA